MDIINFLLLFFYELNINEMKQSHKVQYVLYFTLENKHACLYTRKITLYRWLEKRGCGVLVIVFVNRLQKN